MANFYLDTSAIGNEYQAYADTPTTWGVPQDGNGKAATGGVSAVFEIDCTSAVASGTGTIGVFGVTVSSTLNASGSALATAIVSAVNGTATAVTSTYSALLLALNKLVYARVKPTDANVVQIMVRIAGSDWNSYLPTQANLSPTATISLATTGVDGPFAYVCNTSAVFGKSVFTYGVHVAKSSAVSDPGAITDFINVRTARSGSDLSITINASSYVYIASPAGTHRQFVYDNGTIWAGDNGSFTFNVTGNNNTRFRSATSKYITSHSAKEFGGVKFYCYLTSNQSLIFGYGSGYYLLHNAYLEETSTTGKIFLSEAEDYYGNTTVSACHVLYRSAHVIHTGTFSYGAEKLALNTTFEWTGVGANISGIVSLTFNPNSNGTCLFSFVNCDFVVDGGTFKVTAPVVVTGLNYYSHVSVVFNNCTGLLNPSAGWTAYPDLARCTFVWDSPDTDRGFRYETNNYKLDWYNDGSYPTLNSILPSGDYMSQRLTWDTARIQPGLMLVVGRYGLFYRDAAAVKTVTLEMLVPSAEIPTDAQLFATMKYIGDDGATYYETSYGGPYSQTALSDGVGVGSWTLNGVTGVTSKKIALTTSNSVKQNSEITFELYICGPLTANRVVYINPDLAIS